MKIRVAWRVSLGFVGTALTYLAIPSVFPLLLAIYYSEPLLPVLTTIIVTLVNGFGIDTIGTDGDLRAREAFLAASLI